MAGYATTPPDPIGVGPQTAKKVVTSQRMLIYVWPERVLTRALFALANLLVRNKLFSYKPLFKNRTASPAAGCDVHTSSQSTH